FVLGGPGLGGAPGAPRFRMLAGVSFSSEPPPRLSYLDEHADRELQLALAVPEPTQKDDRIKPVSTWELNSLSRGEAQGSAGTGEQAEPVKPYEPGPGERVALRGDVYFGQGAGELQGVVPLLDQVVLRLAELPKGGTVIIEGHADTEGTDTSNRVVSLRRALAVRRYLIDHGVLGTQIRIRGFGADWPVSATPATEQERQLNRRASVLVVTPTEAPATAGTPVP
ncbi:MAG TPA: OmpA family protein, partial [Myxococcus sp.]|nr:OmpA family protein [Myxococcus sp.]